MPKQNIRLDNKKSSMTSSLLLTKIIISYLRKTDISAKNQIFMISKLQNATCFDKIENSKIKKSEI